MADDDLQRISDPSPIDHRGHPAEPGVTRYRSDELLALHGFGPRALRLLRDALAARGLHLADD